MTEHYVQEHKSVLVLCDNLEYFIIQNPMGARLKELYCMLGLFWVELCGFDWTVCSEVQYVGLLPGMMQTKSTQKVATQLNILTTMITF